MKSYELKTGLVRLSYANIWEPKADLSGKLGYSASLLFDKDDKVTLPCLKATIKEMLADPDVLKVVKNTKGLRLPLRDGDEREDDEAYNGHYFINTKAQEAYPPHIVDRKGNHIYEKTKVYSGCYCLAALSLYPYNQAGNRGIGVGLRGLMFVKDGEPLSGSGKITADSFNTSALPDDDTDNLDDIF